MGRRFPNEWIRADAGERQRDPGTRVDRLQRPVHRAGLTASADARQPVAVWGAGALNVQPSSAAKRPPRRLPGGTATQHSLGLLVGSAESGCGGAEPPCGGRACSVLRRPGAVSERQHRFANLAGAGEPGRKRGFGRLLSQFRPPQRGEGAKIFFHLRSGARKTARRESGSAGNGENWSLFDQGRLSPV